MGALRICWSGRKRWIWHPECTSSANVAPFPKDWSLRDPLQRAALSVPANSAEGY